MALSIKQKLLIAVTAIILAITGLQIWLLSSQMTNQTLTSLKSHQTSLSESEANGIAFWLNTKKRILEAAANTIAQGQNPLPQLQNAAQAGDLSLAYLATVQGEMIMSNPEETLPEGYDPRTRDWYKQAQAASQTIVTQPYEDASSGELVISLSKAFTNGVIAADVSIDEVVKNIEGLKQVGSFAMLTNKEGVIVAHPDKSLTLKNITNLNPKLSQSELARIASETTLSPVLINGQENFINVQAIADSDWYFIVISEKEHALQAVGKLIFDSMITSIIQVLVIGALALFLLNKLLQPLGQLVSALEDLASGDADLTKRIAFARNDEIGMLGKSVDAFVDRLHVMVTDIVGTSEHLATEAKAASTAAQVSSKELSVQQSEISQIAAAVHEMSATATEVASNAEQTASAAKSSADSCDEGKHIIARNQSSIESLAANVEDAAGIIQELEKNTQDINVILSTIQGIAEQTNLLALNAAIEAARAGEQGRGFAVVADEVRVLSQRTHSSTVEIRNMIETLQRNTQNAVTTMNENEGLAKMGVEDAHAATKALERITESITHISDMAIQIASAAEEQSSVTEEVSRNTQAIKDVSDQLSHEAETSLARAQELNQISTHLNTQVGSFKV
ncbi:methyl-accepting chemotaxis protein [Motilimonas sp. 1_MG-2023]|uniref:methyl-accepting chemotaxis protein n=1 Tax=Motilimonas sp. 1_MG-2023 TaxID=3062672 RepID=UPI0026E3D5D6|nr:methyl-accepting chemotaxis protein [Motilimonas sp. 1_MG-2023]MDO6524271.1 methyl-accepting chemotaxis protein [Motilimonas sp. 1_MG-2023]